MTLAEAVAAYRAALAALDQARDRAYAARKAYHDGRGTFGAWVAANQAALDARDRRDQARDRLVAAACETA